MEAEPKGWNYYSDEPIINENGKSKTILKIAGPLISACCFYFLYSGHFDEVFFDKTLQIVPFLIMFIVTPIMIRLSIHTWIPTLNGKLLGTFLAALSVLINGPLWACWMDVIEERAFSAHGIKTKAVVTQAWQSDGSRMYYNFRANGKLYTSFNVANINDKNVGDTIMIIYNKLNPEMNEAL